LNEIDDRQEVINLFMDYETFGEHQWPETGIFDFMRALPERVMSNTNFTFNTPSEVSSHLQAVAPINVPDPISWADEERDLTAWLGNELQDEAFDKLYQLEDKVKKCDDYQLIKDWEYLQTSDHFYYMCTKWFSDGDVHKYFNPYGTPYEAFINYMNVLSDFIIRVDEYVNAIPQEAPKVIKQKAEVKKVVKEKVKVESESEDQKSYRFSDLASIPKQKLKSLLASVDAETLVHALHEVDLNLKDKVLSNIPTKVLKEFEKLEDEVSDVVTKTKNNARRRILNKLKKM